MRLSNNSFMSINEEDLKSFKIQFLSLLHLPLLYKNFILYGQSIITGWQHVKPSLARHDNLSDEDMDSLLDGLLAT
jgi:hypothetical protein